MAPHTALQRGDRARRGALPAGARLAAAVLGTPARPGRPDPRAREARRGCRAQPPDPEHGPHLALQRRQPLRAALDARGRRRRARPRRIRAPRRQPRDPAYGTAEEALAPEGTHDSAQHELAHGRAAGRVRGLHEPVRRERRARRRHARPARLREPTRAPDPFQPPGPPRARALLVGRRGEGVRAALPGRRVARACVDSRAPGRRPATWIWPPSAAGSQRGSEPGCAGR